MQPTAARYAPKHAGRAQPRQPCSRRKHPWLEARSAAKGDKPALPTCDSNEHTLDIVETLAVFHLLMSALNVGLL
jgi:hypothetical protein